MFPRRERHAILVSRQPLARRILLRILSATPSSVPRRGRRGAGAVTHGTQLWQAPGRYVEDRWFESSGSRRKPSYMPVFGQLPAMTSAPVMA